MTGVQTCALPIYPRESIIDIKEQNEKSISELMKLEIIKNRPDRLLLYDKFLGEYSTLIGCLMQRRIDINSVIKDDIGRIIHMQRIKEHSIILSEFTNADSVDATLALGLSRAFSSSLELLWKKLKKIISLVGLNPNQKHLNIGQVSKKVKELESIYNILLPEINSLLDSKLRNCVGHEDTYFKAPDIIVFLETRNGESKVIKEFTLFEIQDTIINLDLILNAFISVENAVLEAYLTPLLKLTDEELEEYCKTGKLTPEMEKKITESSQ